jgi:exodeoxyribonuclease V gamma subunit
VECHVAHALFRQLEILRDQLLARFQADATLHPGDVLVLLPDLDEAAPLIDAVFGEQTPVIPYVMPGVSQGKATPVARLLLQWLRLVMPGGRLPASEVFAFLREPLVMAQLGLSPGDVENLFVTLTEAGGRWGLDRPSDSMDVAPGATSRHTWRDALARCLLGYARPAPPQSLTGSLALPASWPMPTGPFANLLPTGCRAGIFSDEQAGQLAAFWRFLERLETGIEALRQPLSPLAWQALWQQTLADWLPQHLPSSPERRADTIWPDMMAPAAFEEDRRQVQAAIVTLAGQMAAGHDEAAAGAMGAPPLISAEVAVAALETALIAGHETGANEKRAGALTFAELGRHRHLPCRVLCLVGMDDGQFPRRQRELEFDLMAAAPRPGDYRPVEADRNVFLDAILAARETLYLSYTGRSQRDDSELPAALLVTQLLDFLRDATGCSASRLQVTHPLQAFSAQYFSSSSREDARLISFRQDYAAALASAAMTPGAFVDAPLPPPDYPDTCSLDTLRGFFRHPGRAFVQQRLGIRLPMTEDAVTDIEPQCANGLARYTLRQRLLPAAMSGTDDMLALAQGGLEYPDGRLGEAQLMIELEAVNGFARRLAAHLAGRRLEHRKFSLVLSLEDGQAQDNASSSASQFTLDVSLFGVAADVLLRCRDGEARGKDVISVWLDHLAANAAGLALPCCFITRREDFLLPPLDPATAKRHLATWLRAWRAGQCAPLAFYPETAWSWMIKGREQAKIRWLGGDRALLAPEADQDWRLLLRDDTRSTEEMLSRALDDEDFARWRETLLSPLVSLWQTGESGGRAQ